jgi:LDH2 family malate/lactate/ureidoglycolate dehydrogenase
MADTDSYLASVGQLIDDVKSNPLAPCHDEFFYPGELEELAAQRNLTAGGIVLPDQTRDDLETLGSELGIRPTF